MSKKSVCIVGSGNWGSAIAKIVGQNVQKHTDDFEQSVNMYMYEEMFEGQKLTEIVNTKHENVKYLPGIKLPENVVAVPDIIDASKNADVIIFVLPHQFVRNLCKIMQEHIKDTALAVSLIKGFDKTPDGKFLMMSKLIEDLLSIDCTVLMGANLAQEVAEEQFCETTLGCKTEAQGELLKKIFEKPYFRCSIVTDINTVEMCGALKNVVAIGAGIVDGMKLGHNTKAAVLRLGLMEMVKFGQKFIEGCQMNTFFESCGIADLVATCHGGRNRLLGQAVVVEDKSKSIKQLEKEYLKGQSFQGPLVAAEIHSVLTENNMTDSFPMFDAIYRICQREMDPLEFIDCLRNHPEHL